MASGARARDLPEPEDVPLAPLWRSVPVFFSRPDDEDRCFALAEICQEGARNGLSATAHSGGWSASYGISDVASAR
jgi:hypothetical protein